MYSERNNHIKAKRGNVPISISGPTHSIGTFKYLHTKI